MSAALDLHPDPGHPGAVVAAVHEVLDGVGSLEGIRAGEFGEVVTECARAVARLQTLQLRLVAAADRAGVPAATGAANAGAWLASRTRSDQAAAARDARLAADLDGSLTLTGAGLNDGAYSAEHARVIAEAIRRLPDRVDTAARAEVEAGLVRAAEKVDPRELRRRARRALALVEADEQTVDAHEDTLLAGEEELALARSRLSLHDNGDGTTSGHFVVPTLAASILRKTIDALTSPRRARLGATDAQGGTSSPAHRDPAHRRGLALTQVLEHLPTDRLHGKVAATVVVTLDETVLRGRLKAAGLDTGEVISSSQARRLACGSGLLPAVLGRESVPLDLGRTARLFTEAQRVAGATRHTTCSADGCQVPYSWCELHHRRPWSAGGRTDLDQMMPLCGFHHRRIHDRAFEHRVDAGGAVTYRLRR